MSKTDYGKQLNAARMARANIQGSTGGVTSHDVQMDEEQMAAHQEMDILPSFKKGKPDVNFGGKTVLSWTSEQIASGALANAPRIFDNIPTQKTTAVDYLPLDTFSSFNVIRTGNAREMMKLKLYNKDTGMQSRMAGLNAINKPVTANAGAGGALNQTNPNAKMPLSSSTHGTMGRDNFGFGGFSTQVKDNYEVRAGSASMASTASKHQGSDAGLFGKTQKSANSLARTNLNPLQDTRASQASVKNPPSLAARTQNLASTKNLDATTSGGFGGGVVRSGGFQRAMSKA